MSVFPGDWSHLQIPVPWAGTLVFCHETVVFLATPCEQEKSWQVARSPLWIGHSWEAGMLAYTLWEFLYLFFFIHCVTVTIFSLSHVCSLQVSCLIALQLAAL